MDWRQIHPEQQQANIDGNALTITAYDGDKAVAMAGLRWSGGSFANMNIILNPIYKNKGIEKELVTRIFDFLRGKLEPGFGIQVDMNVRSGQETLYESLGFIHSTFENSGVPMRICLTNQIELTDKMFKQMDFKEDNSTHIMDETPLKYVRNAFWSALDKLVFESRIVIDRPKGSRHPKYTAFLYPVDYGYLENTSSMDGGGIDVWKGTDGDSIDAIICTVDLMKKDSEIKILIGCSEDEKQLVLDAHNNSEYMKGILIRRDTE